MRIKNGIEALPPSLMAAIRCTLETQFTVPDIPDALIGEIFRRQFDLIRVAKKILTFVRFHGLRPMETHRENELFLSFRCCAFLGYNQLVCLRADRDTDQDQIMEVRYVLRYFPCCYYGPYKPTDPRL